MDDCNKFYKKNVSKQNFIELNCAHWKKTAVFNTPLLRFSSNRTKGDYFTVRFYYSLLHSQMRCFNNLQNNTYHGLFPKSNNYFPYGVLYNLSASLRPVHVHILDGECVRTVIHCHLQVLYITTFVDGYGGT
jgi:hypothetical protein